MARNNDDKIDAIKSQLLADPTLLHPEKNNLYDGFINSGTTEIRSPNISNATFTGTVTMPSHNIQIIELTKEKEDLYEMLQMVLHNEQLLLEQIARLEAKLDEQESSKSSKD